MRRLYLRDAVAGDLVDDVFVISNKQFAASSNGKFYIKAFISDRTSQITARMWNATRDIFNAMPESGFLKVRGRVENYQNNLQFIIEQLWQAKTGTFDMAELMPHTEKDIPQMAARLREILGTIRSKSLKSIIDAYIADEKLMTNFERAPAAMSFHHAYIGGLLEHTLNVLETSSVMVKFYPGLSRDLVLAGVFLHDIAKTWELSYESAFNYTDAGYLVGHVVKSAMWIDQKVAEAEKKTGEKISQQLVDVLQHIILSHHGELEFGAAKVPSTPEAIFVHYMEDLDAKMAMSLAATRGEASPNADANWTEYIKAFNGRLFRPDPTAGDKMPESEAKPEPAPKAETAGAPTLNIAIKNPLFESAPPKKR